MVIVFVNNTDKSNQLNQGKVGCARYYYSRHVVFDSLVTFLKEWINWDGWLFVFFSPRLPKTVHHLERINDKSHPAVFIDLCALRIKLTNSKQWFHMEPFEYEPSSANIWNLFVYFTWLRWRVGVYSIIIIKTIFVKSKNVILQFVFHFEWVSRNWKVTTQIMNLL